jgi:hypothetical protein
MYSFPNRDSEISAINDAAALLRSALREGDLKFVGLTVNDRKALDAMLYEMLWAIGHGKHEQ